MPVYRNIQEFFFHVPKTASTTIGAWFDKRNGAPGLIPKHYLPHQHLLACSAEELQEWPKYVVVRNTWDRLASWYKYNLRKGFTYKDGFDSFVAGMIATRDVKPRGLGAPQTAWVPDLPNVRVTRFGDIARDFPDLGRAKNVSVDRTHYTEFYATELQTRVFEAYRGEIERFNFYYGE